ncbi:MAG: hypothetical protein CML40_05150 [Rhodobacteraceae bacterium]|nr:MAG: hypothetical protein CML40_05150 [Paracoccaceae bacterium]|tara:strand:- start:1658 stop:2011 length:354 start_codon:yes stop_codon:yes gene_type:complete
MVKKYILSGKTSQDFATAMLNKPQNRRQFIDPFLDSLGIEITEFLFTSGSVSNFVSIVLAQSDENVETLCNIVFASGNFSNLNWSRAFEAEEYKKIFEVGNEKMEKYVSALQVAGSN